jgi:hypothetical protein
MSDLNLIPPSVYKEGKWVNTVLNIVVKIIAF